MLHQRPSIITQALRLYHNASNHGRTPVLQIITRHNPDSLLLYYISKDINYYY